MSSSEYRRDRRTSGPPPSASSGARYATALNLGNRGAPYNSNLSDIASVAPSAASTRSHGSAANFGNILQSQQLPPQRPAPSEVGSRFSTASRSSAANFGEIIRAPPTPRSEAFSQPPQDRLYPQGNYGSGQSDFGGTMVSRASSAMTQNGSLKINKSHPFQLVHGAAGDTGVGMHVNPSDVAKALSGETSSFRAVIAPYGQLARKPEHGDVEHLADARVIDRHGNTDFDIKATVITQEPYDVVAARQRQQLAEARGITGSGGSQYGGSGVTSNYGAASISTAASHRSREQAWAESISSGAPPAGPIQRRPQSTFQGDDLRSIASTSISNPSTRHRKRRSTGNWERD